MDSELMTDEIFGPIIPIVRINSIDEAITMMYDPFCVLTALHHLTFSP